eukprot:530670_1
MAQEREKRYQKRKQIQKELNDKNIAQTQKAQNVSKQQDQETIRKLREELRSVRMRLHDIKDKEYEKKQEKLSRIRDPDLVDPNPDYIAEEKLDYIAFSSTTTATNNIRKIMDITKRIDERNPSKKSHPSSVNRWRRAFSHRFVYGQVAREFEKGKFSAANNTTGRDGGTYRNKNVETINAITNQRQGHKDDFQTLTLCQPQVAYKDHKSVSQGMYFC